MSFVDKVIVSIMAGDGGDGAMSFRHEKFVDRGGPDGGDGGDGGDVILVASRNQNTLASFRYQKELKANPGMPGSKQRKHGRSSDNLLVAVPVGTVVLDENSEILFDLAEDGQQAVVAHGGKGGYGNAHFVSSVRQAPHFAEKGEKGERFSVTLELKMIADVGLVGLPNAGKSTLLSVISNAHPEIANYPFTTLTPNLGVVDIDNEVSLLVADIPGLIEGAAEGKGLGDEFLRHVERTLVLIHLIDAYDNDITGSYRTIQAELKAYKTDLTSRPQIAVLTKIEGLDSEIVADELKQLRKVIPKKTTVLAVSAQSHQGLPELLRTLKTVVLRERTKYTTQEAPDASIPVLRLDRDNEAWHVEKRGDHFIVSGKKIERFAERTDFSSDAGMSRLRDIMRKMGIMHELARQGVKAKNKIIIGNAGKFDY